MTSAEMWQGVGEVLQRARLARKWKPIDVERADGPSYKTVQAIEAGEAGNIESLEKCATALGLALVDVLFSVLASRQAPLSPEAAHIVRQFNETTIAGRAALLAVASALPTAQATSGTAPIPAGGARPTRPRQ